MNVCISVWWLRPSCMTSAAVAVAAMTDCCIICWHWQLSINNDAKVPHSIDDPDLRWQHSSFIKPYLSQLLRKLQATWTMFCLGYVWAGWLSTRLWRRWHASSLSVAIKAYAGGTRRYSCKSPAYWQNLKFSFYTVTLTETPERPELILHWVTHMQVWRLAK